MCPECGSDNVIEKYDNGDIFYQCKTCGYTVENGVVTKQSIFKE